MSCTVLDVADLWLLWSLWLWGVLFWVHKLPDFEGSRLVSEEGKPGFPISWRREDHFGQYCIMICSHSEFRISAAEDVFGFPKKFGYRNTSKFFVLVWRKAVIVMRYRSGSSFQLGDSC